MAKSLAAGLTSLPKGLSCHERPFILTRYCLFRVDGEVRDEEICESFRSNHSLQSLQGKHDFRVVHRSNNVAQSTSTVFIEVDNQVAEILGQHGRISVAGLMHRYTAITSIAICLEQSIIAVYSAYWHGLRAADKFIFLLEDTISRASLPVILGMDANAHSPTWGIFISWDPLWTRPEDIDRVVLLLTSILQSACDSSMGRRSNTTRPSKPWWAPELSRLRSFIPSRTFEWFSRFQKDREKVNDDQHTGRSRSLRCEENKLKIKELIKSNRRTSIKDLSSETGLSVGLCYKIVTKDLDMIRTYSKFVPRILTEEQKEYDPETKRQSSQWIEIGEPKPKKARFIKSKVKTLLVTFFYINGLVHHEFIPFGRTINQEVYLGIMRRLREAVRLKRPERWQNNDWILHVDNARPHTAHVVVQFLAKHSTIQIPHPPYSPDLAPMTFSSILN
ncbi:hypothetical protein LAZ67_13000224 [Cordylochernes scorpioides]|uniref:Transposase n=1 Tax=Cordylochernes scorpioides TaxID=51811 RepID=A0ABY6L3J2_9ARAC|nr:hypothetical protein LAZ67_13000224 [Cordylochernes scorpioides]